MFTVRCPACQTVFRASPQQLGAHGGRVRCGRCHHAFNANKNMLTGAEQTPRTHGSAADLATAEDSTLSANTTPWPPARPDEPLISQSDNAERIHDDLDFVIPESVEPRLSDSTRFQLDQLPPQEDDTKAQPATSRHDAFEPETLHASSTPRSPLTIDDEDDREQGYGRREPGLHPAHKSSELARPLLAQDDDDDDDDRFNYYNNSPKQGSTWLWSVLVGLALGALIVQSTYLFRQDIANQWPESRSWFLLACEHLGCEMPLPADISAIRITTSDLESEPNRPGRYVLHAQIRNDARHAQTHPHLELTLTDSRGTPVVRRVLTPAEWVGDTDLSTSFGADSTFSLRLPFSAPDAREAAGYRLYAFYP